MSLKPIHLAIVDESSLFIKMMKNYLLGQRNMEVVFHTSELSSLFKKLRDVDVNVLLIDVFVHQQNVLDALEIIRSEYPEIKILILSKSTDVSLISSLLDLGIHGYISKMDEPEELVRAIVSVAEGEIHRNKLLTEALYLHRHNNNNSNSRIYTVLDLAVLDDREKRILQLLWEEKSNKEIADEVFLSVRSIEKIRQNMKEKLGVKSTVGLLKYAINKKIVLIDQYT
ncbi:response regulator transcription factor [Chitinophaga varians]|uniref:Response regulator transcription factor n=1 Tax=Chitinophaga varians TaxID=2202339 RepID=A0A847RY92_9BACT|nr:response regulator transcription factor [Chitinophaga varians]NLR68032.1 response regulator transcription factor [Chitinophaga varians]